MRRRRLSAASTAFAVFALAGAVCGGAAPVASADTAPPADLYVDSTTGCSAEGPGTQTVPFCDVQEAADVVEPGQTVHIYGDSGHQYGAVRLTRSGTPSAPITFTGAPVVRGDSQASLVAPSGTVPLVLDGVHDVRITHVTLRRTNASSATVSQSHDVTLDSLGMPYDTVNTAHDTVSVDGASSGVTITRTDIPATTGTGVTVAAGASNVVLSSDRVLGGYHSDIRADGVSGLDVTGDTLTDMCGPEIEMDDGTSGYIENDVVYGDTPPEATYCTNPDDPDVVVDAASAGGVTADYNAFNTGVRQDYEWAGTGYAVPADLTSATGQAAHDLSVPALRPTALPESSPLIDSGNADAPGESSTDIDGAPRVDDPLVAAGGAGANGYTDRGAYERQDTITVPSSDKPSSSQGVAPVDVTLPTGGITSSWGEPLTFSADFGDGTAPVTGTAGTSADHVYTTPGYHDVTLTVTDSGGSSNVTEVATVGVATTEPLQPTLAVTHDRTSAGVSGGMADFTVGYPAQQGWELVGCTMAYGDGPSTDCYDSHQYAHPGTYTAEVTLRDVAGRTRTASTTFQAEDVFLSTTPTNDTVKSIPAHGTITLSAKTLKADPAGVDAAELRLTASGAKATGSLTAYPSNTARPGTPALPFVPGHTATVQETVRVTPTGSVSVYNSSSAAVTVTVATVGLQTDDQLAYTYTPSTPAHVLDTRTGVGAAKAAVAANHSVTLAIAGTHGIPSGAKAVVLDVGATTTAASGSLLASGSGSVTALEWTKGQTTDGLVTVPLSNGKVVLKNSSSGSAQLFADLVGWYGASTTGSGSLPITQVRIVDSAKGIGMPGGKAATLASHGTLKLKVIGAHGVPASHVTAVDLDMTAVGPSATGSLVAYADGRSRPAVTSLDWTGGRSQAGQAIVPVGSDGEVDLYNAGSKAVNLTVDLHGAYVVLPASG